MDKRWIMWWVCVAVVAVAAGCRSARYRVQRYYKYPPTYHASTGAVQRTAAVPPASSVKPTSQAQRDFSTVTSRPPTGATALPTSATGGLQPPAPEKKQTSRGWWARLFGGGGRAVSAPATSASAPVPGTNVVVASKPEGKKEVPAAGVYRLKVGDPVVVYLRGIPGVPGGEQQIENIVGEDGAIPLPYIDSIKVLDMTATEAQESIRRAYVDQQIYKQLTVNVVIPARSYYIRGEVRQPGRYPLMGSVTVLQAIAAAGGYTEFASYSVEIVRGDRRIPLNMRKVEKRPELDLAIEQGDIIVVNRSFF